MMNYGDKQMDNPFKDEEHAITEAEKENYQRNKAKKRMSVILTDAQVIQFAELLSTNASSAKFEQVMNLTQRDVEEQKERLKIYDMDDAKNFLKGVEKNTMKFQENQNTNIEITPINTYTDLNDYQSKTGKRFRMTKAQKQRGLTRDQAFAETYGNAGN